MAKAGGRYGGAEHEGRGGEGLDHDPARAGGVPLLAGGEDVVLGVVRLGDPEGAVGAEDRDRAVRAEGGVGGEVEARAGPRAPEPGGEAKANEEVGESGLHG